MQGPKATMGATARANADAKADRIIKCYISYHLHSIAIRLILADEASALASRQTGSSIH